MPPQVWLRFPGLEQIPHDLEMYDEMDATITDNLLDERTFEVILEGESVRVIAVEGMMLTVRRSAPVAHGGQQ